MPKREALGLLLVRLCFGLVMAAHGYGHLAAFSAFTGMAGGRWLAIGAIAGELLGGLGIAVGLATRLAGGGLGLVMMAIALTRNGAAMGHLGTGAGTVFEYPFLVGVVGWALACSGAGTFSLDQLFWGRKGEW